MRNPTPAALLCCALFILFALPAVAQFHPADLPPLTPDTVFPRCNARQLELAGFPDHMHAHTWSDWQAPVDADGEPYGPGAYCDRGGFISARDVRMTDEAKSRGNLVLVHHAGYGPCDMLPFLGLADMAHRELTALLGFDAPDTLIMVNTDNVPHFREVTGLDIWHFYQREGSRALLQPIGTLQARTLDGHAAYQVVAEWLLDQGLPVDLPLWLRQGLVEYLSEDGVHLVNYMAEFRKEGPVLMTPEEASEILGAGVNPDRGQDRYLHRRACYTSFLCAWELVENQGGLTALRAFLQAVRDGADPDAAALAEWGEDLAGLARMVDPVQLGEPLGEAIEARRPHVER
ncbi:MAG: hypothetical protein GY838_02305 [bacterium]|nr:hypothetical protein [bacterium]